MSKTKKEEKFGVRKNLSEYFQSKTEQLKSQVLVSTPIIYHSGERGANCEAYFRDFLRPYLPNRIGIETGFVVNKDSDENSLEFYQSLDDLRSKGKDPSISNQSDILFVDCFKNASLCAEKSFSRA